MSSRKFFSLICFASLLFVAVFGGMGCGGGGGGSSNNNTPSDDTPSGSTSVTVTFESNGGSAVASQTVKSGETVTKPDNPSKSGNKFVGWYTDNSTFSNQFLFGSAGDKVTEDITLYANWLAASTVEAKKFASAASAIVIGYRQGDRAGHVTGNMTLPTTIEGMSGVTVSMSGLTVSWKSSNTAVITDAGVVTRPAADTEVTLNASITDGTTTEIYPFTVTVMKDTSSASERGQARQAIAANNRYDVEAMNSGSEVHFTYDSSNGPRRISSIEGTYSTSAVQDTDDALDAIQGVRGLLGIRDASDELDVSATNSDAYGSQYSFSQVYNGRRVYGRSVTVSTNTEGTTNFLASNLYPTSSLSGITAPASSTAAVSVAADTPTAAEQAALDYHEGGDFELGTIPTEEIIYTLKEYQEGGTVKDYGANPVVAYVVNIRGTDSADNYLDENVFINAEDNSVICAIPNIHDATKVSARGNNEAGEAVTFDVTYTDEGEFSMSTSLPPLVQMYQSDGASYRTSGTPITADENEWNDPQAVSAYVNMIKVLNWWKTQFNRDSLDGNGMDVKVVVHNTAKMNNASWVGYTESIYINNHNSLFDYSYAMALDVITHESTHAVIAYTIWDFPYRNATGAINEGYADIFGCLHDHNWTIGEGVYDTNSSIVRNAHYSRNAANPADSMARTKGPSELSGDYFIDYTQTPDYDYGGVHINSSLLTHAAYLMYKNGLTWDELGEVWYKSLFVGLYNAESDFHTVRKSVLKAAYLMGWSDEKKAIIAAAFDEEKIYDVKSTLSGTVTNLSGHAVEGATVVATRNGTEFGRTRTGTDGKYSLELGQNTYSIKVTLDSYTPFEVTQKIENLPVILDVTLNMPGMGSLSGNVTDMDEVAVGGVTLTLRNGHRSGVTSEVLGEVVATVTSATDGDYSIANLANGAYNLTAVKEGYVTITSNVTVQGATTENMFIPAGSADDSQYNVYLSWGDNVAGADEPYDLDAHVIDWLDSGYSVEVYYNNMVEYVNGNVISLDRDVIRDRDNGKDQTGPEHMVFKAKTTDNVDYFVHWYNGSGTWASSKARVLVVKPNGLVLPVFSVPEDSTAYSPQTSTCWHILTVTPAGEEIINTILTKERPENPNASSTSSGNVNLAGFGTGGGHYYPPKTR